MKIQPPVNANYAATVVCIKNIIPLENCDNIVATSIFGFQAIIGKDIPVGTIGIVFPAECQLSDEFCKQNNLYRHGEFNADHAKTGYLEDNRRVRAVKFRGQRSDCLFMPLESLKWTGAKLSELREGDTFDVLNGKEICKKYQVRVYEPRQNKQRLAKIFKRVDTKYIPEHFDSDNYMRVKDQLPDNAYFIVTQKLHGTSIRVANTIVKRKLNPFEWIIGKVGVQIKQTEFDYVFGSRKVIKDANNPDHKHFYDVDLWSEEGKKLQGVLPENFIVYGELIGWASPANPIQAHYTYQVPEYSRSLYIYRVAFVNEKGYVVDLTWDQLKEFCKLTGLKHVPELWRGYKKDFNVEEYLDARFVDQGATQCVPLSDPKTVDEGVCIRIDGLRPYIAKAKSPIFYQMETKLLDKGQEDIESSQTIEV